MEVAKIAVIIATVFAKVVARDSTSSVALVSKPLKDQCQCHLVALFRTKVLKCGSFGSVTKCEVLLVLSQGRYSMELSI